MEYEYKWRVVVFKQNPWLTFDEDVPEKFEQDQPNYVYKNDVFIQDGEVTTMLDFLETEEDVEISPDRTVFKISESGS